MDWFEFERMNRHCAQFAGDHEVMGLLVGIRPSAIDEGLTFVFYIIPGEVDANMVHVQFTNDGLAKLINDLEKLKQTITICPSPDCQNPVKEMVCSACGYSTRDLEVVGWYHSHPGHGAFMSGTDVNTQTQFFNRLNQVAIVVDPINEEYKAWINTGDGLTSAVVEVFVPSGREGDLSHA